VFDPNIEDVFAKPKDVTQAQSTIGLDSMPVDQLLELRRQIEALLPVKDIKDLNLSRELVLQVQALQALQQRVLSDSSVAANQQAQCANSLSAALVNLVKLQTDVYTSERMKVIESILVDCIKDLPMEAQEEFLERYETALGKADGS
jgi:hypothetical protein